MKRYIKIFIITILILTSLIYVVWNIFFENKKIDYEKTAMPVINEESILPDIAEGINEDFDLIDIDNNLLVLKKIKRISPLEILTRESERVNFVVFAHDGSRADTMMFVSFDPNTKSMDIINIPRDTYWKVEGYTNDIGNMKINAVYGRGDNLGGSKGVKQAVSSLLQVPVNYYIKMNYNGAAAIVDSLGGLEINVKQDMIYDDAYANPPLHIDLKAGSQVLDGKNAVDYLRWRKNNDETNSGGDLPRISRMQKFSKKAIKKAISFKLPSVVKACFTYIYTDIDIDLAISLAGRSIGMESTDIILNRMPGNVKGYFYVCNQLETEKLLIKIYEKK